MFSTLSILNLPSPIDALQSALIIDWSTSSLNLYNQALEHFQSIMNLQCLPQPQPVQPVPMDPLHLAPLSFEGGHGGIAPEEEDAEVEAISSVAAIREAEKALTPRGPTSGIKSRTSTQAMSDIIEVLSPPQASEAAQVMDDTLALESLLPPPRAFKQPALHSHFRAFLSADKDVDCSPREGRVISVGVMQEEWGM